MHDFTMLLKNGSNRLNALWNFEIEVKQVS